MTALDATHDPALRCWVPNADGHESFPIQNLPFGVFSPLEGAPRAGVAIGDSILTSWRSPAPACWMARRRGRRMRPDRR
jgi:hypothetical protein